MHYRPSHTVSVEPRLGGLKLSERRERNKENNLIKDRAHDLPQLIPRESVWISDTKEKGAVITTVETPGSYFVD